MKIIILLAILTLAKSCKVGDMIVHSKINQCYSYSCCYDRFLTGTGYVKHRWCDNDWFRFWIGKPHCDSHWFMIAGHPNPTTESSVEKSTESNYDENIESTVSPIKSTESNYDENIESTVSPIKSTDMVYFIPMIVFPIFLVAIFIAILLLKQPKIRDIEMMPLAQHF
jgi:hypothetical protein